MKRKVAQMAAVACIAAIGTLGGYATGHAERDRGDDVERIVTRLKQDLVQAYIEADAGELDRIYVDDFTVTDAEGNTRTKATEIESLEAAGSTLTSGTYEPVKIRVFGDVAVMSGHGDLRGTGPDGDYHHEYYSFNVFVHREGRWQYAAAFTP